jgi:hypothetical protein
MRVPTQRTEVLAMPLPDLGMAILHQLAGASGDPNPNNFVRGYFAALPAQSPFPGGVVISGGQSPNQDMELAQALLEAWQWLVNEGHLAPSSLDSGNWFFVTRAGRARLHG